MLDWSVTKMITIETDTLIDCIYLLAKSNTDLDKKLIDKILVLFDKESEKSEGLASQTNYILCNIIQNIINNNSSIDKSDLQKIYLKIKSSENIMDDDPDIIHSIQYIIEDDPDLEKIRGLRNKLNKTILWYDYNNKIQLMMKNATKCKYSINNLKQDELLSNILNIAKEFTPLESLEESRHAIIDEIDFDNEEETLKAMRAFKNRTTGDVLKLGLQGLQLMTGENNGVRLGESVLFYALSHNYKSSMLLKFTRWIMAYNIPEVDPGLKPLCCFISLENDVIKNLNKIYKEVYLEKFGVFPEDNIEEHELLAFLKKELVKNGWSFKIYRKIGDTFGFREYTALTEKLKKEGFQLMAMIIDYVTLMATEGEKTTFSLGDLYSSIKNHANYNNYALISAAQLNDKATEIVNSGIPNFIMRFNTNCIGKCKRLEEEVDLSIFLNIEKGADGRSYLCVRRKKHRYVDNTPEEDKYFAQPFDPIYGIRDDIDKEPTFVRDIHVVDLKQEEEQTDIVTFLNNL
jgi:hypothetical protein